MALDDKFKDAKDQATEKGKNHYDDHKDEYKEQGKDKAQQEGKELKDKFSK